MANRKREIQLKFRVTEEENKFIEMKMKETNISNREAYLRKMAIDGAIISSNFDTTKELIYELNKIGTNINQAIHLAHANKNISQDNLKELKEMMNDIWQLQRSGLSKKHSI
ncbi:TPA: plasmid mobilization relaxosome protein MobC [Listeria monocytogenes]|nr:plasmid mobilization relaxosome protein MobC [Listeria monocytogenes]